MWIWTTGGFLSAVEHRENKSILMVRARDRASLETMIEGVELAGQAAGQQTETLEIIQKEPSDYPWRVVISKATFALFVTHEIMNYLNYHNFKSALTAYRGETWHKAAMNVWVDMLAVTDTDKGIHQYSSFGPIEGHGFGESEYQDWAEARDLDEELSAGYQELEDMGEDWGFHVTGSEDSNELFAEAYDRWKAEKENR